MTKKNKYIAIILLFVLIIMILEFFCLKTLYTKEYMQKIESKLLDSLNNQIINQQILLLYYESKFDEKMQKDHFQIANKIYNPEELEKKALQIADDYDELKGFISSLTLDSGYLKKIPSILPVKEGAYKRFSSQFGIRKHPIHKDSRFHYGLDIAATYGTPVYATADGIIKNLEKSNEGYGNRIEIQHDYGFVTLYGHLSNIVAVSSRKIKQGEVIGFIGSTGLSVGPHLHYEVQKNGKKLDPFPFCYITEHLKKDTFRK